MNRDQQLKVLLGGLDEPLLFQYFFDNAVGVVLEDLWDEYGDCKFALEDFVDVVTAAETLGAPGEVVCENGMAISIVDQRPDATPVSRERLVTIKSIISTIGGVMLER